MEFRDTQAIYLQIADYISEQILLDRWKEEDRIQSVREMGVALQVNPNTVMRAYEYLQNMEIIYNKRGIGYFVAIGAKTKIKAQRKEQFLKQELPVVFKNMKLIEMTFEELEKEYKKY
ncbi:MAG: GntR family transcriptional regulator [Lentimicrobiaceae bacterium]|jgi:DNA-binding transcriptional regulator YhcF (GntR family)|nr:GntR family transcriptional regulator [Lentimicrobiaceae bacterium]